MGGNYMSDNELILAISNMLEPIRDDIQEIKGKMITLEKRVKDIELTQENEVLPRLQNIENCYTSTYDRYKDSVDSYETRCIYT